MSWRIIEGDCVDVLRTLDAESVQTCVTSPPYWGLRDYGTATWEGGDSDCQHRVGGQVEDNKAGGAIVAGVRPGIDASTCLDCGATRVDTQLGLERTPEQYVENLVAVFREVRRVLRDDGTLWLNLGDSYYSPTATQGRNEDKSVGTIAGLPQVTNMGATTYRRDVPGLKPKDLVGIPWMVAFALRADGWVLRSEIIWSKPNPMPESVTDRPTKAHEQLFLFSKAKWTGAEEPLPMSRENAAWLAALIDGEGSICFQERTSKGAERPTYSVRLSVVNTHRGLLERVTEICGLAGVGAPSPRHRNDGSSGRSVYSWQVTNAKAAKVIAAIRPFLVAKAAQADLALAVQAMNRKHKGRGGHSTTERDDAYKRRCAEACSQLNHGERPDLSWFAPEKAGRWVPQPYAYDADAIREDAIHAGETVTLGPKSLSKGQATGMGVAASGNGTADSVVVAAGRNKRTVWTVPTQPFPGAHFATFPPKLIEPCVLAGSAPGDTVLDPFCGAGTTGLVAAQQGRDFIGIELNPEYAEMARERIRRWEANPAGMLTGDPEPLAGQTSLLEDVA